MTLTKIFKNLRLSWLASFILTLSFHWSCSVQPENESKKKNRDHVAQPANSSDLNEEKKPSPESDTKVSGSENSDGQYSDQDSISQPAMISGTYLTQCSVYQQDGKHIKCSVKNEGKEQKKIIVDFIFLLETENGSLEKIKLHAQYNASEKSWVAGLPDLLQTAKTEDEYSKINQVNSEASHPGQLIQVHDPSLVTGNITEISNEEDNYHKIMVLMLKNIEEALSKNDI